MRVYADHTEMRDPVIARYRAIVVRAYVTHRAAGYNHTSVLDMIQRHYGTTGHDLLLDALDQNY